MYIYIRTTLNNSLSLYIYVYVYNIYIYTHSTHIFIKMSSGWKPVVKKNKPNSKQVHRTCNPQPKQPTPDSI